MVQTRRELEITPSVDQVDMYDLIDHFYVGDDDASILTARNDVEQLAAQEVGFLDNDICQLADSIDRGDRAYSENKKQYMDYFVR